MVEESHTTEQLADMVPKPLGKAKFEKARDSSVTRSLESVENPTAVS
jgi:hypothetical protein